MKNWIFIVAAIVLEITSIATVILQGDNDSVLIVFLLQHAASSAFLSVFVWNIIPDKYKHPQWQIILLLFNFSFFIPLLGLIGMLTAVLMSLYKRRVTVQHPFATLVLPEFVLSLREPDNHFSQGGIKSRLAHTTISTPKRLQSLLALQGMPARISSPLLQDMLGDASDDIRLVAYGLLDNREKKINTQIHRELVSMKASHGKELRLISLRHLAELYWELVYAGLAQGDLRLHALNQSLSYADDALSLASDDTGLWFLKGRILHQLKKYEEAYEIFEQTLARGLPESRVLPYIVEIAFNRHDYKTVRELLTRLSVSQVTPIMKGAINFWVSTTSSVKKIAMSGGGL
ncbi:MAG: tetratricopeptide repeat protein [Gallionellaceae bacterium]